MNWNIDALVESSLIRENTRETLLSVLQLAKECLVSSSHGRPSIDEICIRLHRFKQEISVEESWNAINIDSNDESRGMLDSTADYVPSS